MSCGLIAFKAETGSPPPAISDASAALSDDFFQRIRRSYKQNIDEFAGSGDSMWNTITSWRSNIHDALYAGPAETAIDLLLNPASTRLYWGVDSLADWTPEKMPEPDVFVAWALNSIIDLSVALGAAKLHNPEGAMRYPRGSAAAFAPFEALLDDIDKIIGVRTLFPNPFSGEIGLGTSRGIACAKALNAVYQAFQLKMMTKGDLNYRVLEIGAGLGRTAYYALSLGIQNYTIVDLPLALVGQAVFLGLVLGEDAVSFGDETAVPPTIRLLTPNQLAEDPHGYSIVLNADSFTEMAASHVRAYFARMIRDKAQLLSINHEGNHHTVREFAPASARVSRHLYALRAGYVEERFDFSTHDASEAPR